MAHGRAGKIDNYRRLKSAVIAANAPKSRERSFYAIRPLSSAF
jgi:hypothetical protein